MWCVKNSTQSKGPKYVSQFYLLTKILDILQTAFSFQLCQFSQGWVFIYEDREQKTYSEQGLFNRMVYTLRRYKIVSNQ